MANELVYDYGVDVSLPFTLANVPTNATTALTLVTAQGADGFKVPTGYKFHPLCIHGESNADLTAGSGTFKVTDNTTVIANGPEPVLNDTVQVAVAVAGVGDAPIAAGKIVGLSFVADASFAPPTADVDAILVGKLLPA
jgi:hypothetical protein